MTSFVHRISYTLYNQFFSFPVISSTTLKKNQHQPTSGLWSGIGCSGDRDGAKGQVDFSSPPLVGGSRGDVFFFLYNKKTSTNIKQQNKHHEKKGGGVEKIVLVDAAGYPQQVQGALELDTYLVQITVYRVSMGRNLITLYSWKFPTNWEGFLQMLEDFCEKWADLAFLWELHGFPIEMCFVFSVFCRPPGQPLPRYTKMTAEKDVYFYSFVHKNAGKGTTDFYRSQNRRLSAAKSAFFGRRRFTLESPTRWTPPARMSCSLHPTSGPYPSLRCLLSRRLARSRAEFFGNVGYVQWRYKKHIHQDYVHEIQHLFYLWKVNSRIIAKIIKKENRPCFLDFYIFFPNFTSDTCEL